jgi:hypothetical protein
MRILRTLHAGLITKLNNLKNITKESEVTQWIPRDSTTFKVNIILYINSSQTLLSRYVGTLENY